jgi:hypothetical protein
MVVCKGVTKSGAPCKKYGLAGQDYCHMHVDQQNDIDNEPVKNNNDIDYDMDGGHDVGKNLLGAHHTVEGGTVDDRMAGIEDEAVADGGYDLRSVDSRHNKQVSP